MICFERDPSFDQEKGNKLCRMCFLKRPAYLNVFDTFITEKMTIADVLTQFLGENIYPDDDLPEYICCDCIEEVVDGGNIKEAYKAAIRHSVWRLRLLKILESQGKELFVRNTCKSPSQKPKVDGKGREESLYLSDFYSLKGSCVEGSEGESIFETDVECMNSGFHECDICSGIFLKSSDLEQHKIIFHKNIKSSPCGRCWRNFWSPEALVIHIEKYNFQCKFQVTHAEKTYTVNSISLKEEVVDGKDEGNQKSPPYVKEDVKYSCSVCAFLSSKSELTSHLTDVHLSECPLFCRICRTGFISRFELGLHQVKHDKTFFCITCEREFLTKRYYNKHVKVCQKKIVVNKCEICGKELSTRGNLRLHMTSHSMLRKFKCSLCPKTYKLNRHLLKHVRSIHMKLKPHKCLVCGNEFSLRSTLQSHYATHSDDRPYSCSHCPKKFKLKSRLRKHGKTVHKIIRIPKKKIIIEDEIFENIIT